MWPVDCSASPAKPGQAKSEPSGPIVWACPLWISHGPMCTPSAVAKPRFFVSSRRNDIFSSTTLHESQTRLDARAGRRHARAVEGLALRADDRQRNHPLRGGRLLLADDRLEGDLRQPRREVLRGEEVEERGIRVGRLHLEVAADRDPGQVRHGAHVGDDLVERALAAAQRARDLLCASRSPSSVILMPFSPSGLSRSTISRVSSSPLVMMLMASVDAARRARARAAARRGSRAPACSAAARRRRTSGRGAPAPACRGGTPPSARAAPPSPSTSSRRSCCSRRGPPGCSSRTRSCTAGSSAP